MSETVLINGATVLAAAASAVEAYGMAVPPQVDFRVECDQAHSVRFYVANADFATVAAGAILTAYTETAIPTTAGTNGNVYTVEPGSYDFIACVVTNDGAVPATVTVAVGYDLVAEAPAALFTVAEARAFDKAQLASVTDYPDATIVAKEAEIRALFTDICGVDFIPTVHGDEYQDGNGSSILLKWPLVTAVTSASIRTDTTWTPLTADELAAQQIFDTGEVYFDCSYWPLGRRNVKVTYTAGYASVPEAIKRAALLTAVSELPTSNVPFTAESYDAGGISVSYAEGDGYNDNWSRIAEVRRALRLYSRRSPGIA